MFIILWVNVPFKQMKKSFKKVSVINKMFVPNFIILFKNWSIRKKNIREK